MSGIMSSKISLIEACQEWGFKHAVTYHKRDIPVVEDPYQLLLQYFPDHFIESYRGVSLCLDNAGTEILGTGLADSALVISDLEGECGNYSAAEMDLSKARGKIEDPEALVRRIIGHTLWTWQGPGDDPSLNYIHTRDIREDPDKELDLKVILEIASVALKNPKITVHQLKELYR